jgi:hypothetical protein
LKRLNCFAAWATAALRQIVALLANALRLENTTNRKLERRQKEY